MLTDFCNVCFRMPLSRAEIQKRYRERKKSVEGEKYLEKERARQLKYYKPVAKLTNSERKKRNEKIKARVKKHRLIKKCEAVAARQIESDGEQSSSGYGTNSTEMNRLIVRLPNRGNGPRRRLSTSLKKANEKMRKIIHENIEIKRKLKTTQRRLQRLRKKKQPQNNLTPRSKTNASLRSSGLSKPNAEKIRKQLLFGNVIMHEMNKMSARGNNLQRKQLYASVAGSIVQKYRQISKLSKELNVNRNKLSNIIRNGVHFEKIRRRRTIAKYTESVTQFLEREDNCRMQPGKRDVTNTGQEKLQTRILTDYMSNLHQKYLSENPEHKISLSTFCRIRPKHIKTTHFLSRNVCLCTKHQNFGMKLQMMRKVGIDVSQNPETFIQSNTEIRLEQLPETVVFSKWKRVILENNKKKMKIVTETLEREQFYEEWQKSVEEFKVHFYNMKTQYKQTKILKENLQQGEIVIHMDFAENYSCKTADEVQSAYWNASQITLHPMVIYFKDEDGHLKHQSYVAVSDELSHSASTVLAILKRLYHEEIDLPGCSEINYVHYWTDSPSSQYRNRYIFHTVANHEDIFGSGATWNYYEAGHGKNVCDGLGGTVKRLADESVRSGKCTIQDAEEFMMWATNSSMKEVKFFFVCKEDCQDMATIVREKVDFRPVKGTLKIHSVKINDHGQFCTRDVSCYCQTCLEGLTCDSWAVIQNTRPVSTHDPASGDTSEVDDIFSVGKFVAAVYEGSWYIGQITEVDDTDTIEIKFMDKKKEMYQWPRSEDKIWVEKVNVLCEIESPTPSGRSGRMFQIKKDDIVKIEALFCAF